MICDIEYFLGLAPSLWTFALLTWIFLAGNDTPCFTIFTVLYRQTSLILI